MKEKRKIQFFPFVILKQTNKQNRKIKMKKKKKKKKKNMKY